MGEGLKRAFAAAKASQQRDDLAIGAKLRDEVDRLYARIQRLEAALEECPRMAANGCSAVVVDALQRHVERSLIMKDDRGD